MRIIYPHGEEIIFHISLSPVTRIKRGIKRSHIVASTLGERIAIQVPYFSFLHPFEQKLYTMSRLMIKSTK